MKNFNINNIEIPIYDGPIGISLSGGADSALLLYILMSRGAGPIIAYNWSSKEKNRRSPHHALDIIGRCIDLTGNNNIEQKTIFVERQIYPELMQRLYQEYEQGHATKIYIGTTQHPPDSVLDTFESKLDQDTYLDRNDSGEIRHTEVGPYVIPFRNSNKKDIARLYSELNILESIFPLTRSCEDLVTLHGHCGHCWWCEERRWGFDRLE